MANPDYRISALDTPRLYEVKIEDMSDNLIFGRRFKIVVNGVTCSEGRLFKDIFDDVKTLAENANNDPEKLKAAKALLTELSEANNKANIKYDRKDFIYHFLTGISRLLSSGDHPTRINDLNTYVDQTILALPPLDRFAALKHLPNNWTTNNTFRELAENFFIMKDFDHCLESIKKIYRPEGRSTLSDESLLADLIPIYLENGKADKALEAATLLSKSNKKNDYIVQIAMHIFKKDKNPGKALMALQQVTQISKAKDNLILQIAIDYWTNSCEKEALETIELITDFDSLKFDFKDDKAISCFGDGKYKKAFDLVKNHISAKAMTLALSLSEAWFKNKELDNALEALQYIQKRRSFTDLLTDKDKANLFDNLVCEVATSFYKLATINNNLIQLQKTVDALDCTTTNSETKNKLLENSADFYFNQGSYGPAFDVMKKLPEKEVQKKHDYCIKVADAYAANRTTVYFAASQIRNNKYLFSRDEYLTLVNKYDNLT